VQNLFYTSNRFPNEAISLHTWLAVETHLADSYCKLQ